METELAATIEFDISGNMSSRAISRHQPVRRSHLVRHVGKSPERRRVEAYIATEYRHYFDAELSQFMPTLIGLHDSKGNLKAAVGYRAASAGTLFLEAYTNGPIEEVLRMQSGLIVPREQIVEVGSLACNSGRAAIEMVTALVPALIADGFSWVVFTGADTVRNVFRRLYLKPIALCIANRAMLGEQQHEWGSYYDHNPVVMAGRLADAIAVLEPTSRIS